MSQIQDIKSLFTSEDAVFNKLMKALLIIHYLCHLVCVRSSIDEVSSLCLWQATGSCFVFFASQN